MEQTSRQLDAASPDRAGILAFAFGPFQLHLTERLLQRDGRPVPLGGRAFDILALLVQRAGQVVRHDELIGHVWTDVSVSPGTPRVHLTALRKALECRPDRTRYIANVPGRGYCFVAPVITAGAFPEPRFAAGRTHPVPPGLDRAPARPTVGLEPAGPMPGGAVAGPFAVKHRLRAEGTVPSVAEQLLATPNTRHAVISGKFGPHRELDPGLGWDRNHGASVLNGSQAQLDSPPTLQGEDPEMARKRLAVEAAVTLLTCVADAGFATARAETAMQATGNVTHYRTADIDGVSLFYREAGPPDGPVVLLLHGFPTSSHMFRNLIPALADRYRVIAPDYPGFGQSAAPDHTQFAYTFARYASLVDALLQRLGAARYAMYVMDYGAPVGYRLALLHPERVTGLVVQNGNAYAEGPRVGHVHVTVDNAAWHWADASGELLIVKGLEPGPHSVRIDLADPTHRVIDSQTVHLEIPPRAAARRQVEGAPASKRGSWKRLPGCRRCKASTGRGKPWTDSRTRFGHGA